MFIMLLILIYVHEPFFLIFQKEKQDITELNEQNGFLENNGKNNVWHFF